MVVNIWLVLFNMIPAFPMDGGQVCGPCWPEDGIHARTQASRHQPRCGAGVWIHRLFTNPLLLFIALFVWIGASQSELDADVASRHPGAPGVLASFTRWKPTNRCLMRWN